MLGSEGATATLPIDRVGWSSKSGWKVVPAFSVLNSPPVPVATKNCDGFPGTRAISLTRPPMLAGPIDRQERERMRSGLTGPASPGCSVAEDAFSRAAGLFFGAAPATGARANRPIENTSSEIGNSKLVRTKRRADGVIGILQIPRGCRERVEDRATRPRPSTGFGVAGRGIALLTPPSASHSVRGNPTHEQDADPRSPL